MSALFLFITVFSCLLLGFPVSFTLGGVSMIYGISAFGLDLFNLMPLRIWGSITNFVLVAVPLFVYMGVMLEKSGIAEEMLETMALLFGKIRGGMAISVIVVGAMLAAATGIVGATVVTMGLLSLPTMVKRGYNIPLSCGTICAAGTLGQIIPPSIALVLIASVFNISIGDIYLGSFIPGFILVGLYLLYIIIIAIFKGDQVSAMPDEDLAQFRKENMVRRIILAFLLPMSLIVAVLGSIFAGIASPTESAAVGALGASILALAKGQLTYKKAMAVMYDTTNLTAMVFILLIGAAAFGLVFRGLGGDSYIIEFIERINMSPMMFLLLVNTIIFIAGFFIDYIEITFIILPIVGPIFQHMGLDLLWVGVLIGLNFQTSFLTPPFGFSLFYLQSVAPKGVTIGHIYRGVVPFIIIQIIGLLIVIFYPDTVFLLPKLLAK
ncbi:MAG: TRAP transporter large permease subunit [Calditerrivibrio sp.]|nr:TRAP transporter large permease subunit [Calditerrivibrio sp.]MCA1933358.1 TRAP transporter large permease subunit [Calditerrivibrio sp.]MCA1980581.1 TRAP transporter large permease subunit [Calditerrivibrio sp.]